LKALRINTSSRACVVGVDELEKLIREPRSLSQGTYSEAVMLAAVLEAWLADEIATAVRGHLDAGADHVALQAVGEPGIPHQGWTGLAEAMAT
jgi:hypothetical protein